MKYKLYSNYQEFREKNNLTHKEAHEILEKELERLKEKA